MSLARCMLVLAAAMCVQAEWVDFVGYSVGETEHLQKAYEANKTHSECRDIAESLSHEALLHTQINDNTALCVIFTASRKDVEKTRVEKEDYIASYYYEPKEEGDSHDLSAGEIAATIVLSIFYTICLVILCLTCKHEDIDIAAQMDKLEKRELEIEEAVSEHFERKSQDFERKSQEAEAKEMEEKAKSIQ